MVGNILEGGGALGTEHARREPRGASVPQGVLGECRGEQGGSEVGAVPDRATGMW